MLEPGPASWIIEGRSPHSHGVSPIGRDQIAGRGDRDFETFAHGEISGDIAFSPPPIRNSGFFSSETGSARAVDKRSTSGHTNHSDLIYSPALCDGLLETGGATT